MNSKSQSTINTARLRKIVGWVERQRNPTNADKCWVTLREDEASTFLNPTYTRFKFLA
ncbi:hypothetical protein G7B40_010145 [Aetokthonos hydrillicola Thurmond2011]|uniref:Uncharacterized protein n=1 Tax=Aetokthonos hydrillicola Thurmond2011 TaxID=2712845 RepID=A0AAP5I595_9CYAN|nr:hypothetical protein [Aetokthonos hydrillicola]MBO3459011.1 hypothetical protein [Aetokthonos hydrillicola CCALA 1050]MBW4589119.1 hypothetical protein [Aetokthonos hydrillicola CCALA 1050]MDR9894925.1 hypothetical protein [Aetokthonos hydrillicola Thurmond2011]